MPQRRKLLTDTKAATAIEYGLIAVDRRRRDYRNARPGEPVELYTEPGFVQDGRLRPRLLLVPRKSGGNGRGFFLRFSKA